MRIIKTENYEDMSRKGAAIVCAQVILKPDCVLGLATGSSPEQMYAEIIQTYQQGGLDFSSVSSVNLDEYRGLEPDNSQSYRYFMNKKLFEHVNIDLANTYVPDGLETDTKKACKNHDDIIEQLGGIDLQVLGMGMNGHIGFNEPGDHFENGTQCMDLTDSTIEANSRFFASRDEVPKQAYTMGIGSIMRAKKILLLVSGEQKAEALAKALTGPVTPQVPASILQLHADVTVVADEAALSVYQKQQA